MATGCGSDCGACDSGSSGATDVFAPSGRIARPTARHLPRGGRSPPAGRRWLRRRRWRWPLRRSTGARSAWPPSISTPRDPSDADLGGDGDFSGFGRLRVSPGRAFLDVGAGLLWLRCPWLRCPWLRRPGFGILGLGGPVRRQAEDRVPLPGAPGGHRSRGRALPRRGIVRRGRGRGGARSSSRTRRCRPARSRGAGNRRTEPQRHRQRADPTDERGRGSAGWRHRPRSIGAGTQLAVRVFAWHRH